MASTSRILELASTIQTHTTELDSYMTSQGLQSPSWDLDTPPVILLSDTAKASRTALLESMEELKALILGPVQFLIDKAANAVGVYHKIIRRISADISSKQSSLLGLEAVVCFDIQSRFPINEEASFATISQACGLAEDDTKRFLRLAMVDRIFKEPQKGVVAHTPASKALTDPVLRDYIRETCQELWPAASRTVDAVMKWPYSEEPTHTGFSLANNTKDSMFVELEKYPERARRFANGMKMFSMRPGFENEHIVEGYDWATIGTGLLVDIGGSNGSLSIAIAERFPEIRCIVQDLPQVVMSAEVPPALANRFQFIAHDFFNEQKLSADIYLLRWVLHNWSDKYSIKILRNLIPALKHGAKVLIVEACLPEPGVLSPLEEREIRYVIALSLVLQLLINPNNRNLDIAMKQLLNAKERSADDWAELFHKADPGFQIVQIKKPRLSKLSIIEFCWKNKT